MDWVCALDMFHTVSKARREDKEGIYYEEDR